MLCRAAASRGWSRAAGMFLTGAVWRAGAYKVAHWWNPGPVRDEAHVTRRVGHSESSLPTLLNITMARREGRPRMRRGQENSGEVEGRGGVWWCWGGERGGKTWIRKSGNWKGKTIARRELMISWSKEEKEIKEKHIKKRERRISRVMRRRQRKTGKRRDTVDW